MHFRHLDISDRLNTMIRDVQHHTPQPQKIAWYLEIDNLSLPIVQQFVGTGPPGLKNVCGMICLPLMHQIAPGDKGTASLVQTFQYGQFSL